MMQSIQIKGQVYNYQTSKSYDAILTLEQHSDNFITKISIPRVTTKIFKDGIKGKTILKSFDVLTFWMSRFGLSLSSVNWEDIIKIEDEKLRAIIIKLLNAGKLNYNHKFVKSEADRMFMEEYQSMKGIEFEFSDIDDIVTEIQSLYSNGNYTTREAQQHIFGAYLFSSKQEPLTSFSTVEIGKSKMSEFKIYLENIVTMHTRIIDTKFANDLRMLVMKTVEENKVITTEVL